MSDKRYSADLIVTAQGCAQCNWEKHSGQRRALRLLINVAGVLQRRSPSLGMRSPITRKGTVVACGCLLNDAFAENQSKSLDKLEDIVNRV